MRRTILRKEWSDKYKGKFDEGWDKYRDETFTRQKQLGLVPDTLNSRHGRTALSIGMNSAPTKSGCRRLMENYAGFGEYADQK